MSDRVGPWIQHDGKGYPKAASNKAYRDGARIISFTTTSPGIQQTPAGAVGSQVDIDHPGWTWRRKYFLFGPWVASDRAYARIIRYRFHYPPGASAQVEMLREIATGQRQPESETA